MTDSYFGKEKREKIERKKKTHQIPTTTSSPTHITPLERGH